MIQRFLWIGWLICIAILSFIPGNQLPKVELEWITIDTLAHLFMYAVLSLLMLIDFGRLKKQMNLSKSQLYIGVILIGILFGYLVEVIQGEFIYRRYFDTKDLIANGIGTIFGAITYRLISIKLL